MPHCGCLPCKAQLGKSSLKLSLRLSWTKRLKSSTLSALEVHINYPRQGIEYCCNSKSVADDWTYCFLTYNGTFSCMHRCTLTGVPTCWHTFMSIVSITSNCDSWILMYAPRSTAFCNMVAKDLHKTGQFKKKAWHSITPDLRFHCRDFLTNIIIQDIVHSYHYFTMHEYRVDCSSYCDRPRQQRNPPCSHGNNVIHSVAVTCGLGTQFIW